MKFAKAAFSFVICCSALSISAPIWAKDSPAPAKIQAQKTVDFTQPAGDWKSDWGPVSIQQSSDGNVTGSWIEGKDKVGKIVKGKFDKTKRVCVFDFEETWTKKTGTATLSLSADGKKLAGTWVRGKDRGNWEMKR